MKATNTTHDDHKTHDGIPSDRAYLDRVVQCNPNVYARAHTNQREIEKN